MTSRAVCSAYDAALLPSNLSSHQFGLLSALSQRGPQAVRELAHVLGMEASGIPRAVKPLADRGLVAVSVGTDRRQRIISITPAGLKAFRAAMPAWKRIQTQIVREFGADRWRDTIEVLARLRQLSRKSTRPPRRAA